jgi:hypothetical protein
MATFKNNKMWQQSWPSYSVISSRHGLFDAPIHTFHHLYKRLALILIYMFFLLSSYPIYFILKAQRCLNYLAYTSHNI